MMPPLPTEIDLGRGGVDMGLELPAATSCQARLGACECVCVLSGLELSN